MSLLARRGRHESPYPPPAQAQERTEEDAPTLIDARTAGRERDFRAIVAAELTALANGWTA
jgi:hypothetical protein